MADPRYDAVVVGAGHNGLVAATLLARAGRRVAVVERGPQPGGATVSASPFAGVDARLSRYSYLVSLFPRRLLATLGIELELRGRRISSYTPEGDTGLLIGEDPRATRASFQRTLGADTELEAMQRLYWLTGSVAAPVFETVLEPLVSAAELQSRLPEAAWAPLFERPISELLESGLQNDLVRGIVATDALIGTFAALGETSLRQNRCFLYHVIGNGTGRWDVPVGGMGTLTRALVAAAVAAGVEIRCGVAATGARLDGRGVSVELADGATVQARHLLCGAAPAVLADLLGAPRPEPAPEGSQLKLNLLLARLPRLRDPEVSAQDAFAGTFHVHESYSELESAHISAAAGRLPDPVPLEAYCHSLTDPSILGPDLRAAGAQTLTAFALHMPARLFEQDPEGAKRAAVAATMHSLDSVLAEPIEDCLWRDATGEPCLEARTPIELEAELGLPAGHIFHRDLAWPFAETEAEIGTWGVETEWDSVWLCGAGARRGGGVSGIPGHNAAAAVMAADSG